MAKKGVLSAHLTPGNPGNSGGKKGRSGRPPKAFKDFLGELRKDPKSQAAFRKAARDPEARGFSAAWKIATDYDDAKPAEKHAIVGPIEVRVRIAREGKRTTAS